MTGEKVMKRFDDRTVIVTGGARGMGASHARGFVAEGANVVIADVLEQEGRTLADELAIFSRLDITSEAHWAATVVDDKIYLLAEFRALRLLARHTAITRGTVASGVTSAVVGRRANTALEATRHGGS